MQKKKKKAALGIGQITGSPPKYRSAKEMLTRINEYFEWIKGEKGLKKVQVYDEFAFKFVTKEVEYWVREPEKPTITGLTLFLGFCQRNSLDYWEAKPMFSHIIKSARAKVEYGYELGLHSGKPVGSIFALKNMGWHDKVETGITDKNGNDVNLLAGLPTDKLALIEKLLSENAINARSTKGNS